ncbi:hypothetical protein [Streptomyces sp. NBC_01314]|uniref:hypothetical protein n=1 Tax=Streptomyces sp. NBC_01314 TaxID=2903821 RepID=UPI00308E2C14|nr:hypothetical protein OG622_28790 [Streptomyces sp. NBC_01314]
MACEVPGAVGIVSIVGLDTDASETVLAVAAGADILVGELRDDVRARTASSTCIEH